MEDWPRRRSFRSGCRLDRLEAGAAAAVAEVEGTAAPRAAAVGGEAMALQSGREKERESCAAEPRERREPKGQKTESEAEARASEEKETRRVDRSSLSFLSLSLVSPLSLAQAFPRGLEWRSTPEVNAMADSWEDAAHQGSSNSNPNNNQNPPLPQLNPTAASFSFNPASSSFVPPGGGYGQQPPPPPQYYQQQQQQMHPQQMYQQQYQQQQPQHYQQHQQQYAPQQHHAPQYHQPMMGVDSGAGEFQPFSS